MAEIPFDSHVGISAVETDMELNRFGVSLCVGVLSLIGVVLDVQGHGMMLEPVNRGSRWRYNRSAPRDYDDNAAFCGGAHYHWSIQKGRCGLCGDSFGEPTPRAHEHTGKYGQGVIVRKYVAGQLADISVRLTTNHKGFFTFDLCNLDTQPESEECFAHEPLELNGGGYRYILPNFQSGTFNMSVVIPSDVICNHCVLRWTYTTGNSWGICDNGSGALGCGPQETFKSCSDISIAPQDAPLDSFPLF